MDFLRWIFYAAAKQAKLSGKMSKDSFRKDLSMPGLLREMRECFDRVPDLIISRGITLSDCLMAGLAMFSLKIPSMLKYDQLVRLDENTVQAENPAIIHPEHKEVLPLAPEPILKEDGADKNDCERNAAKRLVNDLRREHPHLKAIIVGTRWPPTAPILIT